MVHQVFRQAAIQQMAHSSSAMRAEGNQVATDRFAEVQNTSLLVFMIEDIDRVIPEEEALCESL